MKSSKLRSLLFLLFISLNLFGQKNKVSGEVEYQQLRITASGEKNSIYNLHFNGEESYYEENIFDKFEKGSTQKSDGTTILQPRDNNNPQFYFLNNSGELYFSEFHVSKHVFVKESKDYRIKWKITNEKKKIGEFECQKAIGEFRGRTYNAWFTLEIPLPFGPWKLNGLPGLILEAYDDADYIYFTAKKVYVLSNNRDSSDYIKMKVDDLDFEGALSIDEFQLEKDILLEAYFQKISARLPKGVGPLKLDKDCKDCGESWEIFD